MSRSEEEMSEQNSGSHNRETMYENPPSIEKWSVSHSFMEMREN